MFSQLNGHEIIYEEEPIEVWTQAGLRVEPFVSFRVIDGRIETVRHYEGRVEANALGSAEINVVHYLAGLDGGRLTAVRSVLSDGSVQLHCFLPPPIYPVKPKEENVTTTEYDDLDSGINVDTAVSDLPWWAWLFMPVVIVIVPLLLVMHLREWRHRD